MVPEIEQTEIVYRKRNQNQFKIKTVTVDKLLVSYEQYPNQLSYREIIIHFSRMISVPNLVSLTLWILQGCSTPPWDIVYLQSVLSLSIVFRKHMYTNVFFISVTKLNSVLIRVVPEFPFPYFRGIPLIKKFPFPRKKKWRKSPEFRLFRSVFFRGIPRKNTK